MLNKNQMSPEDLDLWKESSSWYFDHLKELLSTTDEAIAGCAKQILVCDLQHIDRLRLHCAGLAGRAGMLQELIDMEYSHIVEDEE